MSRLTKSADRNSDPTLPRPPSLETAAANSAEVAPAPIPASMIGTSMPRRSQSRVLSMVLTLNGFDALEDAQLLAQRADAIIQGQHPWNRQSSSRRHNDHYGSLADIADAECDVCFTVASVRRRATPRPARSLVDIQEKAASALGQLQN